MTSPAPVRNAASAERLIEPASPADPPMSRACPKLPLWLSAARRSSLQAMAWSNLKQKDVPTAWIAALARVLDGAAANAALVAPAVATLRTLPIPKEKAGHLGTRLLAIAADALGAENVLGVLMPSCYSSAGSVADSEELARNLGIRTITLPISGIMQSFEAVLTAEAFRGLPSDVTEEHIQLRIRGTPLMALSNKFGSLLLTTGNKSEISVGYCTLYGDMNGGLAVVSGEGGSAKR